MTTKCRVELYGTLSHIASDDRRHGNPIGWVDEDDLIEAFKEFTADEIRFELGYLESEGYVVRRVAGPISAEPGRVSWSKKPA